MESVAYEQANIQRAKPFLRFCLCFFSKIVQGERKKLAYWPNRSRFYLKIVQGERKKLAYLPNHRRFFIKSGKKARIFVTKALLSRLHYVNTIKKMAQTTEKNPVLAAFERIRQNLRSMATRLLGDEDDADDALQDAFVKLWVRRSDIHTADEAAALMTVTVRNLSIDKLRRQQTSPTVALDEERDKIPDDEAALQAETEERYRQVQRIIAARLTPLQQKILRMRDCEDLGYEEIAQALEMQPAAVRMQLSRARKTVRCIYREQQSKP